MQPSLYGCLTLHFDVCRSAYHNRVHALVQARESPFVYGRFYLRKTVDQKVANVLCVHEKLQLTWPIGVPHCMANLMLWSK